MIIIDAYFAKLFGNIQLNEDSVLNEHNNFQTFFMSLLTLFKCSTGENWQMVMQACAAGKKCHSSVNSNSHREISSSSFHSSIDQEGILETTHSAGSAWKNTKDCGTDFAYVFFISFVFFCVFLMLNLFVAVIMENFDYLTRDNSVLGPHHLDEFIRVWAEHDPTATGRLHHEEFYAMLKKMEPPLGFGENIPNSLAYRKLIQMNVPVDVDYTVHFTTCLMALIRQSLRIKLPPQDSPLAASSSPKLMSQLSQSCRVNYHEVNDKLSRDSQAANEELRRIIIKLWPVQAKRCLDLIVPISDSYSEEMNLTIGKIYAGKIILQNWRDYKAHLEKNFLIKLRLRRQDSDCSEFTNISLNELNIDEELGIYVAPDGKNIDETTDDTFYNHDLSDLECRSDREHNNNLNISKSSKSAYPESTHNNCKKTNLLTVPAINVCPDSITSSKATYNPPDIRQSSKNLDGNQAYSDSPSFIENKVPRHCINVHSQSSTNSDQPISMKQVSEQMHFRLKMLLGREEGMENQRKTSDQKTQPEHSNNDDESKDTNSQTENDDLQKAREVDIRTQIKSKLLSLLNKSLQ